MESDGKPPVLAGSTAEHIAKFASVTNCVMKYSTAHVAGRSKHVVAVASAAL
jgi:hypothetical protein